MAGRFDEMISLSGQYHSLSNLEVTCRIIVLGIVAETIRWNTYKVVFYAPRD